MKNLVKIYKDLLKKKTCNNDVFLREFFPKGCGIWNTFNSEAKGTQNKVSYVMNGDLVRSGMLQDMVFHFMEKPNRKYIYALFFTAINDENKVEFGNAICDLLEQHDIAFLEPYKKKIIENKNIKDLIALVAQWMIIYAIVQDKINLFDDFVTYDFGKYMPRKKQMFNEPTCLEEYLLHKGIIETEDVPDQVVEIPYPYLFDLRNWMIRSAGECLYISGETLSDAFSYEFAASNKPIVKTLIEAINSGRLKKIKVFMVDPAVFRDYDDIEPLEVVEKTVGNIINHLAEVLKHNNAQLEIYFLPFLDIDHAVINDNYMLFRTTKLWTSERNLKGIVELHKNRLGSKDAGAGPKGEYSVHKKYLDMLAKNSVWIDTTYEHSITTNYPKDMYVHKTIRNLVHKLWQKNNESIKLYKLYESQLKKEALSSFKLYNSRFHFTPNDRIKNREALFDAKNLLNDKSQEVLLKYIKETERLLNKVVKKYDKREESGAVIIPSLDLGYPNNVMRLAGGFATGMLIDWDCGTSFVPIDATVNVCTSSVFKITPGSELLNDFEGFVKKVTETDATSMGYSFSLKSGNHFLMLATDEEGDYYLVLHSSVKEMKESYLGLYPSEVNWYSSRVKSDPQESIQSNERYIRYIKGEEATYFIKTAHYLEKYNVEIHEWIASKLNCGRKDDKPIIRHHYYMPTDSSIVIGTFVEAPGEVVPLFSNVGKPVYLFEIGKDNWTYNLGGNKGEVCIVPHGWGQQIENVSSIQNRNGRLILGYDDGTEQAYQIYSKERFKKESGKRIRQFSDGQEFLEKGRNFVSGEIKKILTPEYLYCQQFIGKVEK